MTQELIEIWGKMHGLSPIKAMLDLKFYMDIVASNKKAPALTEAHEVITDNYILPQIEYDENQLSLTYEGDALHA